MLIPSKIIYTCVRLIDKAPDLLHANQSCNRPTHHVVATLAYLI